MATEERIRRVEAIVAEVTVHVSACVVCAAFRDDVDVPAQRASELGLSAGCHHLKLVHRIDAVGNPAEAGRIIIRREPIDDEVV